MKTFSVNALVESFEIDRSTAQRALKTVAPDLEKTKGRPTYKIATFARALEAHHLKVNGSKAADSGDGNDSGTLTAARTRVTVANAELKERLLATSRGELVRGQDVIDILGAVFSTIRELNLSLAGKISDALANICGAAPDGELRGQVFQIVSDEVRETLTILASPESYVATAALTGSSDAATSTEPDTDE